VTPEFVRNTLILTGIAVSLGLLIAAFVYAGGSRNPKRYRPGRPFTFAPVWFLSAPEEQSRAGIAATPSPSRELTPVLGRVVRPRESGGASDRW
jgi:hypothetical protein